MRKASYEKIDEKIEYVTVCHKEIINANGDIIQTDDYIEKDRVNTKPDKTTTDAFGVTTNIYDEVVEKVVPIMGTVYRDMTQEEIEALPKEEDVVVEPTTEDRLNALEGALLEMILGGM